MKPRYLDHGFWRVSAPFATRACGKLPKPGYEALGKVGRYLVWVARTPHQGRAVWSVRACESGNDVELSRTLLEAQ